MGRASEKAYECKSPVCSRKGEGASVTRVVRGKTRRRDVVEKGGPDAAVPWATLRNFHFIISAKGSH